MWREGGIRAAMNGRTRDHDWYRQHRLLAEPDRNLRRREPQVALHHPTGGCSRRSTGSAARYLGRSARTRSRNQEIEPVHPTHSTITAAGIEG